MQSTPLKSDAELHCEFWRHSKYLLPKGPVSHWLNPSPSPTRLSSLAELAADPEAGVQLFDVSDDTSDDTSEGTSGAKVEEFPVRVFDGATLGWRAAEARAKRAFVARIRGASSVGRACCLIGAGGRAIRETGFHFSDRKRLGKASLRGFIESYRLGGDLRHRSGLPPEQQFEGRVAAINNRAAHNYYHWLVEVAPRIAALDLLGIEVDRILIDCQSGFQREVLSLLGVPTQMVMQPHCRLNLRADEMFYVSDASAGVLRHFAELIAKRIEVAGPKRKIYISRRQARNRKIVDETQLERMLAARGFESVCFEDYSVAEQFRIVRQAETIVTVHGAALANTLFAEAGTNIIEIFPRQRRNMALYAGLSRDLGLNHSVVFGDYTHRKCIRVDPRAVDLAIEHADSAQPAGHQTPVKVR